MQLKTIRIILVVAIILLVTSEILSWALGLFGAVGGGIGIVLTSVVYIFCARKAKAGIKYNIWILLPTVILVVIPTVAKVWDFLQDTEPSVMQKIWTYGPFFLRFIVPVVLLLLVYLELGKYIKRTELTSEDF